VKHALTALNYPSVMYPSDKSRVRIMKLKPPFSDDGAECLVK